MNAIRTSLAGTIIALAQTMAAIPANAASFSEELLHGEVASEFNYGAWPQLQDVSADLRYAIVAVRGNDFSVFPPNTNPNQAALYVNDRQQKTWKLVDNFGVPGPTGHSCSSDAQISASGRWVVFACQKQRLSALDDIVIQLYSQDMWLDTVQAFGPMFSDIETGSLNLSGDGNSVVLQSGTDFDELGDTNGEDDIYRVSRLDDSLSLASVSPAGLAGNGKSIRPSVSHDGNRVVFESAATNFVTLQPDQIDTYPDVFMHEFDSGITSVVSDPSDSYGFGAGYPPAISGNGQVVTYYDLSSNLVRTVIATGESTTVFSPGGGISAGFFTLGWGNTMDFTGCKVAFAVRKSSPKTLLPQTGRLFDCETGQLVSFGLTDDLSEMRADQFVDTVIVSDNGRSVAYDVDVWVDFEDADPINTGTIAESGVHIFDTGDACDAESPALRRQVLANTWVMLAIPCLPVPGQNTVGEIFSDDIPGVYGIDWAIFPFDTQTNTYIQDTDLTTSLQPGTGFWLRYNSQTTPMIEIDLPADSNETATIPNDDVCGVGTDCQQIELPETFDAESQWAMLGLGRSEPVQRDELRLSAAYGDCSAPGGCSMSEADDNADGSSIIHRNMYIWDASVEPASYRLVLQNDDLIYPWDAIWIAQYEGITSNPVRLHVPVD